MSVRWRRAFRRTAGVLSLAVLASLVGCSALGGPTLSTPKPGIFDPRNEKFYTQVLTWTPCESDFTCTRVTVPIDWSDPEGDTTEVALIRHAATDGAASSLGSLFVNPGGPGSSGIALVRDSLDYAVDETLTAHYDIIGFDPRGVGESNPVTCTADAASLDNYVYSITPGERGSAQWLANRKAEIESFAAGCEKYTGALLAHVDTLSVARDLDVLRAAVGDAKLNYLGYSYGTLIGAFYASTFPTNVGHLVLDGAVDPTLDAASENSAQAAGFEMALRNWLAWCLQRSECPFDGTVDESMTKIGNMIRSFESDPKKLSDGRVLGADTFVTAIVAPLYSADAWDYLIDLFSEYNDGTYDTAMVLADWYNGRKSDGTYDGNENEAFLAIGCLDTPASDPASWGSDAAALERDAPVFGRYFAYSDMTCAYWPYPAVRTPETLADTGEQPIVVIGTSGDPATPIAWAQDFVSLLTDGRLIEYGGEGHTGYNRGSSCVNDLVDTYFVSDVAPPELSKCAAA